MKMKNLFLILVVTTVLSVIPAGRLMAESFSIDWFTIDGGGGTSVGGQYLLSGTIGQPDANAPMAGGNFSITGGFWNLPFAVQTVGAPTLTIMLTASNTVVVSWAYPSSGFALQESSDLKSTNWVTASQAVTNNGTSNYIIVDPTAASRFYRLYKP